MRGVWFGPAAFICKSCGKAGRTPRRIGASSPTLPFTAVERTPIRAPITRYLEIPYFPAQQPRPAKLVQKSACGKLPVVVHYRLQLQPARSRPHAVVRNDDALYLGKRMVCGLLCRQEDVPQPRVLIDGCLNAVVQEFRQRADVVQTPWVSRHFEIYAGVALASHEVACLEVYPCDCAPPTTSKSRGPHQIRPSSVSPGFA